VGGGIKEILDAMKMKQVTVENYLTKNYAQAVYTQIDVMDYNSRIDGKVINKDFYTNPTEYVGNFERFTKVSEIVITGHFMLMKHLPY
jgi:ascorbate-specific PTS system EIIC-type component UlaA